MVIIREGKTLINGDPVDIAIDTITFMDSINEIKKRDYKAYEQIECLIQALVEEDQRALDTIKEFALNMTEVFS